MQSARIINEVLVVYLWLPQPSSSDEPVLTIILSHFVPASSLM